MKPASRGWERAGQTLTNKTMRPKLWEKTQALPTQPLETDFADRERFCVG